MTSPSGTETLASFLTSNPGGVAERRPLAQQYLLDTLGAIVFGAGMPWTRIAAAHAKRTGGDRPCTVVGAGFSTTPAMAAFANGAAAHAFELDDVHEEAISHPGAVCVPTALAIGQAVDSSGPDLLDAITIGYEAMGRAGIAVGAAPHMLRGFHPTGQSGVFGAAATAGSLLGLDAGQLTAAFGIAATFASGVMEFSASGGDTKRLHAGRAAEGGLTAALLAADGFSGPTAGLDGKYGWCNVFATAPEIDLLTAKLGERWMIDEITVKPYAACSDIHPLIQAAQEIAALPDVSADRIASVHAEGPTKAAEQNNIDGAASVMAAQYSGPFNIAAAFVADPGDPDTYHPDRIRHPAVAELQAKVDGIEASPECDATYAWKMAGRVAVTLDDGTVHERFIAGQKGSMHDPLSTSEIEDKFRRVAGTYVPDPDAMVDGVDALRNAASLSGLFKRLRSIPPVPEWGVS